MLVVKNLSANAGDARDLGSIPGLGRSPGAEMGMHSSISAQKSPWTEEPGVLQSMGWQRNGTQLSTHRSSIFSF